MSNGRMRAVLGPTNTGKTHYAIERMLAFETGVIGLPLRLLAREIFDKLVGLRGPEVVALVTGEERIIPAIPKYWVCTTEAMPRDNMSDCVVIDEVQLCADPERGHVFTDRLLRARGRHETLFLGSFNMRGPLRELVPEIEFVSRERFSNLTYSGSKKISRLPTRSAIVGFSVDNVYAIAELIRRQKGGAAVVMGALSPRTRNAQVAMYQNGDVDFLVATDAIGMGLNLDIDHVAFSGLSKFDGRKTRRLASNELAQIAGRAGRYKTDGTFGVTGEAPPLEDSMAEAIEQHRFTPIKKLQWRNSNLQFGTVDALIRSLSLPSDDPILVRAREADDQLTLQSLALMPEIRDRVRRGPDVRLLWDVCQIPDFRKVSATEHSMLVARMFEFMQEMGYIDEDWLATRIKQVDKTHGDIDALSKRLAFVRTWTYVTQRKGWVENQDYWREETRAVEDRLSDALHAALTQRFVDRRTSVLMRRLKQKEALVAEVNDKGEVRVEDQFIGQLTGFRFQLDPSADANEAKTLRSAAISALQPAFSLRADKFYNAPDTEFDITDQGGLMWGDAAVGKLLKGDDILSPIVQAFVDDEAGADVAEKVTRRLNHYVERKITAAFEPLIALRDDETVIGLAKGVAFQLVESLGVIPRSVIADDVKSLDQDARGLLRKHGIRFGQFTIFQHLMLKPAPTRLRLLLWALMEDMQEFPDAPPPGLVTIPEVAAAPNGYYPRAGYRMAGLRAIRIDMLERLADLIRAQNVKEGFEATPDMLSITGMTLEQFADLMQGLGYKADRGEREKAKPQPDLPQDVAPAEVAVSGDAPEVEAKVQATVSDAPTSSTEKTDALAEEDTLEVFYTFTWQVRSRPQNRGPQGARQNDRPRKKGKPKGSNPKAYQSGHKGSKPKGNKPVDPDSPFAALAALKNNG
ncbi:MAG: helicase-related protein [Pseudomonadota bacterium]